MLRSTLIAASLLLILGACGHSQPVPLSALATHGELHAQTQCRAGNWHIVEWKMNGEVRSEVSDTNTEVACTNPPPPLVGTGNRYLSTTDLPVCNAPTDYGTLIVHECVNGAVQLSRYQVMECSDRERRVITPASSSQPTQEKCQ
jgi:hypothetical protein